MSMTERTEDPLNPSPALLVKLGSIIVHFEEFLSTNGHEYDKHALDMLQADQQVQQWFKAMHKMAILPVKR